MFFKFKNYFKYNKVYLFTLFISSVLSYFVINFPLSKGFTYEFAFIVNIVLILFYPLAFYFVKNIDFLKSFVYLIVPVIFQLIVAKNLCNPFKGVLFYLFMPLTTLFLVYNLLKILKSNVLIRYYIVLFLSLSGEILLLYSRPQIFFYNSFWGYFQGSLYDLNFGISTPLIWLALFKITNGVLLYLINRIVFLHKEGIKKEKFAAFFLLVFSGCIYFYQDELGMTSSREHIKKVLGGKYESKHFNIYYPLNSSIGKKIRFMAIEHEMRLYQLEKMYGIKYGKKIDSYIFKNSKQKKKLMGAGNTLIAKPWLGEIYINYDSDFPNPYLKHELSHVIAAKFSNGFLKIPMKFGLLPQMGIVEGFAVSSEDEKGSLTLFEKMAVLKKKGRFPPVERMVSFDDFWSYNGYFAYQTVGAFLKFLRIKYGADKVKELYLKESFKKVYHKSISELKEEFLLFLDKFEIRDKYVKKVKKDFSQKSVFKRVCPHDIAEIKENVDLSINKYGFDRGIKTALQLLKLEPWNENHRLYLIKTALKYDKFDFALNYVKNIELKYADYGIKNLVADVYWLGGKEKRALELYEEILKESIPDYLFRSIYIKTNALKSGVLKEVIENYLLKRKGLKSYLYNFNSIKLKPLEFDIVNYLYGRYYFNYERFEEAVFYLSRVKSTLPLNFKIEILRLLMKSYFYLRKYDKCIEVSERLINTGNLRILKEEGKNFIFYAEFFKKHFN